MTRRGSRSLIPAPIGGPVHFRIISEAGALTTAEIGIDYSKAQVPDRSYYADCVEVRRARSGVDLLFGKLIPGTSHLRTQVEVIFPDEMFLRQLWRTSRELHGTLEGVADKFRVEPLGTIEDTDKVQSFRSNNAFMGMWGEDAVIDFYYLSPRALHQAKTGVRTKPDLEPVVRIALYSGLLLEFLNKCGEMVPVLESSRHEEVSA